MEENRELTRAEIVEQDAKFQAGSELFGMCDDGISESF